MPQLPLRKLSFTCALAVAVAIFFAAASHRAIAQSANPGISLQDLGGQNVSGTTWNFSGDFPVSAGAWESVTITNYGYCFVGPNDPRAGSAHAGGVFYYTDLSVQPGRDGYTFNGTIKPGRGGDVTGTVNIVMSQTTGMSHVDISLSGSNLQYYQDNTLEVCLLGSS